MDAPRAQPASSPSDASFADILLSLGPTDESALADAIETDAAARAAAGRPVNLDRYLDAIPDLASKPDALDVAISVSLASLKQTSPGVQRPAEFLVARYPALAPAIRDAALLDDAIISTPGLAASVVGGHVRRNLPCDFGPEIAPGRPRYQLIRKLGAGSFGQVYLANDRMLGDAEHAATVALKILNLRGADPVARARAAEEANRARRIVHPNVVRVLDRGSTPENEDFIVFDYIAGGNISQDLQKRGGRLEPLAAAALVAQIARGVQAAHSAGLVHCDLKPSNILLSADGVPLVADFGVAVDVETESNAEPSATPDASSFLGNLAFISPEQFRKEPGSLVPATDVYALGGILFLLLTGRLPNGVSAEEIARTHDRITGRTEALRIADPARDLDEDLEAICRRALAPLPANRYTSAGEFAADLEAWCERRPIFWTRPTIFRRVSLLVRRQPMIVAISAAAVALAAIAAVTAGYYVSVATRQSFETTQRRAAAIDLAQELPEVLTLELRFAAPYAADSPANRVIREDRLKSFGQLATIQQKYPDQFSFRGALIPARTLAWMLLAGDNAGAKHAVADLTQTWRKLLPEDHPIFQDFQAISAAIAADELAAKAAIANPSDPEGLRKEARDLHEQLVSQLNRVNLHDPKGAVAGIISTALIKLTGEKLLNAPDERQALTHDLPDTGAILLHSPNATPAPGGT